MVSLALCSSHEMRIYPAVTSLDSNFSKNNFIHLFINFWLQWVFTALHGLSLIVVSRGYTLLWCVVFSLQGPLLLWSWGSRHVGFRSCSTQAQQSRLVSWRAGSQQLWRMVFIDPQHVGSFWSQGSNRYPLHWQAESYPLHHQGSPPWILNENKITHLMDGNHPASPGSPLLSQWSHGEGGHHRLSHHQN